MMNSPGITGGLEETGQSVIATPSDSNDGINGRENATAPENNKTVAKNELMECVRAVLDQLTKTPVMLFSCLNTLNVKLISCLSYCDCLKDIVELIFNYSITAKTEFLYIAAKLCMYLSKEQSIQPKNPDKTFRSIFMNRCRDEHLKREENVRNPDTVKRVLGFAMFEAKLFCQYRPLGETEPLKVFHRALLEMFNTLMEQRSEDCLMCLGEMLKMTGYLFDDQRFMNDQPDRMNKVDKVFSDVEELSKDSNLSDSVRGLLSDVITLRASQWRTEQHL